MQAPGDLLLDLCQHARSEVLLVAPFVKLNTLQRILDVIADDVFVQCVTRWRPDEIAAGVSDIEIWPVIRERPNMSLWLRTDLHAKYYRGDKRTLVGSANLTSAALGWAQHPNLELLIGSSKLDDFETRLFDASIKVDEDIYLYTKQILELFPQSILNVLEVSFDSTGEVEDRETIVVSLETWIPTLRHPEKLYDAYIGKFDALGKGSRIAALKDLQMLGIPSGLGRAQFEAFVGGQLLQMPLVREVDRFVETPQRFGAVRDLLKKSSCAQADSFDADHTWQTLMRWLIHFRPGTYFVDTSRHTEQFRRR